MLAPRYHIPYSIFLFLNCNVPLRTLKVLG